MVTKRCDLYYIIHHILRKQICSRAHTVWRANMSNYIYYICTLCHFNLYVLCIYIFSLLTSETPVVTLFPFQAHSPLSLSFSLSYLQFSLFCLSIVVLTLPLPSNSLVMHPLCFNPILKYNPGGGGLKVSGTEINCLSF